MLHYSLNLLSLAYFILLCFLFINASIYSNDDFNNALQHRKHVRLSLYNSTWPSDHGDIARSKYTIDAGLPSDFEVSKLKIITQEEAPQAQWLYTYGENSKYLYVIGGIASEFRKFETYFIKKLNSETLEILQTFELGSSLYLGGMLMHSNGHVYCIHANILYVFFNGDLSNFTKSSIPSSLNGNAIQTNGMLVTTDGYLVIKQWNFNLDDAFYLKAGLSSSSIKIIIAAFIVIISMTIGIRIQKASMRSIILIRLPLGIFFSIIITAFIITLSVRKMVGQFDIFKFMSSNIILMNGGGGGELKLVDPISLKVIQEIKIAERCSFGRMAMTPLFDKMGNHYEDSIILLGDENIYQYRWRPSSQLLYLYPQWTRRYRSRADGGFPGTGPSIYNGNVYFTDNTYSGFLYGRTFKLFKLPLEIQDHIATPKDSLNHPLTILANGPGNYPLVDGVYLTEKEPGFFFFSAVISPIVGDVIIWDTGARKLQSRKLDDLSLHWEISVANSDCITVSADKNLLYITDYSDYPKNANEWMTEVIASRSEAKYYEKLTKYFLVLNASNGIVLANITIGVNQSIHPAMIVSGQNNDVFVGLSNGVARVYAN